MYLYMINKYNMANSTLYMYLFTIIFLFSMCINFTNCAKCERLSACSCECPDGIIDIELMGLKNGQPKYKDELAQDQYQYSYNPCKPFTETDPSAVESHCQNVAACQVIIQSTIYQFYDIGTQESVSFETRLATDVGIQEDGEVVVAKYLAAGGGRQSEVAFVCNDVDDNSDIAVIGELPQPGVPTYRFIIVSPNACFISKGLSAGTILLIVYFSGLAAYLLFGVLYKKFIKKASGRDLLPNSDLWFSCPGLVRDGSCFVLGRKIYNPV